MLDVVANPLEEQRLLVDMNRAYRERGAEIREESDAWEATLPDGLPDEPDPEDDD